ncbi:hypothetical protein KFK09_006424 [Dendrobium nobile]|uniref:Uncharacterized protein n=1 Tax=Dendrobium nobile TaxID=94219 RepID=A0A8T3BP22_DENNO|nr:hypothetical protein KFK09_006424 [Dendrobium nobile]
MERWQASDELSLRIGVGRRLWLSDSLYAKSCRNEKNRQPRAAMAGGSRNLQCRDEAITEDFVSAVFFCLHSGSRL